ncbi:molybdopterin synthase subunit MoaD [Oryzisolibacter propanilivorax]|uniref:Molybdopterin synthase sulfur carrier subunit n=1 Tax=Oryzisolibacter propanilivorax TaxID=1527607 RepID=A0A1G9U1R7_9BURK|nr:molybdopterin converting factor subunit 1 [Oryzisolibacter propanilivorax]SDM53937.1 molybdopterin synthase subunit MoaD [Oryzisolibacter propanilivorax]
MSTAAAPKTVHVRYFASIREALGTGQETLQTTAATLGALRDELIARGEPWAGCLARGRAVRMALNQDMARDTDALPDGAEAAFFPPVTGG